MLLSKEVSANCSIESRVRENSSFNSILLFAKTGILVVKKIVIHKIEDTNS